MAFPRAGRPAGNSCVWTPPVPPKDWAPHAFRSALSRATPRAGNPLAPRRWTRRWLRLRLRSCFARRNRVSRACGPGRRGVAPRLAADAWARLWSAGAASANRLPPSPESISLGRACFRGLRLDALPHAARGSPSSLGYRPATTRLRFALTWHGLLPARASLRVRRLTRQPALAHG